MKLLNLSFVTTTVSLSRAWSGHELVRVSLPLPNPDVAADVAAPNVNPVPVEALVVGAPNVKPP